MVSFLFSSIPPFSLYSFPTLLLLNRAHTHIHTTRGSVFLCVIFHLNLIVCFSLSRWDSEFHIQSNFVFLSYLFLWFFILFDFISSYFVYMFFMSSFFIFVEYTKHGPTSNTIKSTRSANHELYRMNETETKSKYN